VKGRAWRNIAKSTTGASVPAIVVGSFGMASNTAHLGDVDTPASFIALSLSSDFPSPK